ncbi:hypothetical protein GMLC_12500 [Geomonas limicola]|uniref:Uncharacterized protein n=1 Tax=Geomonas limicola TaxID=2740186 RepID=A0A6V8N5E7_9BACT|nr:hypothetical protein [Geomonas limicola]GFO67671.1 hypothetical protein GMLC_12500 [Geomonas limicola]
MDSKGKQGQKTGQSAGQGKQRSDSEQTRSGVGMERQSERQQPKTTEQQKHKEGQSKSGKK